MADEDPRVSLVKTEISSLTKEKEAVQLELTQAKGVWWFSPKYLSKHNRALLFHKQEFLQTQIEKRHDELKFLLTPHWLEVLGKNAAALSFVGSVIGGAGTAIYTGWRYWTILRIRYGGGLTDQQLRWRKVFLNIDQGFSPTVMKVGILSAAYFIYFQLRYYPLLDVPKAKGSIQVRFS